MKPLLPDESWAIVEPLLPPARWVVERTRSRRMDGDSKRRRRTEQAGEVVDFSLFLAAAFVVIRRLIRRACTRYRWAGRPPGGSGDAYRQSL